MDLFDRSEYMDRLARVKKEMANRDIDLLLINDPNNTFYLTGYYGMSFYMPQTIAISPDWDEPLMVLRGIDVPCAELTVFFKHENIVGYGDEWFIKEGLSPWNFIADTIRDRGAKFSRVGVEKGGLAADVYQWELMQRVFAGHDLVDASGLVNWARIVKSDRERQYMREAAKISEEAIKAAARVIRPGVRENDAAAAIMQAQIAGTPEFGGLMPFAPTIAAGDRTAAPHLSWTEKVYENGTPVNIELSGNRNWYCGPISRSIYVGTPPDRLQNLAKATGAGMDAAFDIIKPGVPCSAVEAAFRTETKKYGVEKVSRMGYTCGIYVLGWLDGTASLSADDNTELLQGMTFHMMLGMWEDGYGYVLSEAFEVTENGVESMCSLPRELTIIN